MKKTFNIGIIGSGSIGGLLGKFWANAGHNILLSSRNPEKLKPLANEIGNNVKVGSVQEAAEFGDIILMAVNYKSVDEALQSIGNRLDNKIVIDATNPLGYDNEGKLYRMIPEGITAGEFMAKKLPKTKLIKSFTTLWSEYLRKEAFRADELLIMPVSGDNADAKDSVSQLIEDAGFSPYDLGKLKDSRPQDPGSNIWNKPLTLIDFEKQIN
ncbi:NAD(P)-binding domain-containing protein [uncultured Aquimarina sp.]|uniref:NADPH-dependent F420 reductase n=1 Tax=uncultured Aquimarina sp. TaxID=575652 RepID=UPI002603A4C1|nr:NAD(P)-binding domain-containing protein [uncultured Aquimarina sp.]